MTRYATLIAAVASLSVLLSIATPADAAVIAQYQFEQDWPEDNDATVQPHTTPSDLTITGASWGSGASAGNTLRVFYNATGATQNLNQYISFTVGTDPLWGLDLTTLTFTRSWSVSDTTGHGAIRTNLDGYANNVATQDWTGSGTVTFDLSSLTGVEDVTFRLYIWDESNAAGGARHNIDNLTLNGSVIEVPEPASLALMGLGGLLMLSRGNSRGGRENA